MTRAPDKFIAMAIAQLDMMMPAIKFNAEYVYELASALQQAEENPPRVKCQTCAGMFVKPAPCLAINCGFKESRE